MAFMESLRSGTDSTFMQIVFGLVVLSFIGWGAGMSGTSTQTKATVNGEAITGIAFSRAVSYEEQRAGQGRALSDDERADLRERVLQGLIRERALVQEAQALGLHVSNKEIASELMEYTFLKDSDGVFDKRAYQNFLRRQGLTRADFEEQLREQLLVTKLQRLMMLGASVSEPSVERRWLEQNTKVDLSYVRITPSMVQAKLTPTDEELDTWIAEHPDEIQARYDRDLPTRYDQPETVNVRMIRLAIADDGLGTADLVGKLDAIRAEIEGGADMGALAARWSEDPSAASGGVQQAVKVGSQPTEVQEALDGVEDGALSKVVATSDDVRLYRVEARNAARVIPLEEVERGIAASLFKEQEGPVRAAALAEKELLPAWRSDGTAPAALLDANGLSVRSTGLVTGLEAGGGLLSPPADMMKAARGATVGAVLPEVYESGGTLWVGQVTDREDPDRSELVDKRDEIREQALLQRRIEFFQDWSSDVVARATIER